MRTVKDSNKTGPPLKVTGEDYIHFYQAMKYTENRPYASPTLKGVPGEAINISFILSLKLGTTLFLLHN